MKFLDVMPWSLAISSALKMAAAGSSEMLVPVCKSMYGHIPEHSILNTDFHDSLKCHKVLKFRLP
jgi:hypothetical protein